METNKHQKRRLELTSRFSRTLFVISSGSENRRSPSISHRFKVSSDFFYLTGLDLAEALLVVVGGQSYLLTKAFGNVNSVWDDNDSLANSKELLNGLQIAAVEKLEEILRSHLNDFDRIATALGRSQIVDDVLLGFAAYGKARARKTSIPLAICDSTSLVGTLRLKKDADEISFMREAAVRSSRVHERLMRQSFVGKSEREISNWIEAQFLLEGMQWTAYETIVGAGERSTLLHARATDRIIQNDDIIVIDAGGEWKNYCADITRALPAGKRFTAEQRRVYETVLTAQKNVLREIRPGQTLQALHQLTKESLIEGLAIAGYSRETLNEDVSRLMPHSTSHWIGLDVHDPAPYVGDTGEALRLEEGMTFTVEPGIYDKGIGVRIEDDVLVTANGVEILTSVAKEIHEIEALRADI
ncbi:aminopeptidase P N-terminal domain-containing protein [Bdellovibrio bacteriovorus]|uniref:aminopeptidase P N-terminal domain-containing protein n=1 Tax=Bdellovibrio bacteriovorus TaxID=959 RepID=UPI0035A6BBEB